MSDTTATRALLLDSFGRIRELVVDLTDGLTPEVGAYRPDAEANSIAWLLWHLTRIQDDHVAGLAGVAQIWPRWRDVFDLPFDDWATGYAQSADDVGKVRVDGESLAGYHRDVHDLTTRYVETIDDAELERIVDRRWDPPVTASVRITSVIGDALQHLGQAAYVRGLAERRDQAWHQPDAADR